MSPSLGIAARAVTALRTVAAGTADLIFPPACLACGSAPLADGGWLCKSCSAEVFPIGDNTCPRCGKPLGPYQAEPEKGCHMCRNRPLYFSFAVGAVRYSRPIRQLILKLKFARLLAASRPLSDYLVSMALEKGLARHADLVIPVPLSWRRQWSRGYNQSEVLARRLANSLRLKLLPDALLRVRATPPQASLAPAERKRNLQGAFAARHPGAVRRKRILLVDDVMTTGATCAECARALMNAGARRVIAAVVAR